MEAESILLKKPSGMDLIEYFKSLNVFEKRSLIDELSDVKSNIDKSVKSTMPYFALVFAASVFGTSVYPTALSFIYFGLITVGFGFMITKKVKSSLRFKFIIEHMTKNM